MRKSPFFFSLLVLTILLLTGCSCKHQWEDAFCVSAEVCTSCGQVQGVAQNKHSFSEWKSENGMEVRTCMFCGFQESIALPLPTETESHLMEPIPQVTETLPQPEETEPPPTETVSYAAESEAEPAKTGLYMTDITGHWTSRWIELDDVMQSCHKITTEYSLDIFPDGTYQANLEGKTMNGKWTFIESSSGTITLSYDLYSGDENHYFDKGWKLGDYTFIIYPNGELRFTDVKDWTRYSFCRMTETAAEELEATAEIARKATIGTWVSYLREYRSSDGHIIYEPYTDYSVTFHADGTIYHSMPEWNKEHTVETNWYVADIHTMTYGSTSQIDFLDEDTQIPKHFYLYSFDHPSTKHMCLEVAGQGSMTYIHLKPANR